MGIPFVAIRDDEDEPLVKELPNLQCVGCDLHRRGGDAYKRFAGVGCCVSTLRRNQRKIETMIMLRDNMHRT